MVWGLCGFFNQCFFLGGGGGSLGKALLGLLKAKGFLAFSFQVFRIRDSRVLKNS